MVRANGMKQITRTLSKFTTGLQAMTARLLNKESKC